MSSAEWPSWLRRLGAIGARPGDSDDERLDKAILTLAASLMATMAVAWIAIYLALGLPRSAAIPFAYQLAVVACLFVFARTGRLREIRVAQLVLILVLPFALQWSLGGFANGSAVAAWAGVAPILAFLFRARGGFWLLCFLVLLAVSGAVEPALADRAPEIGERARSLLFVMNVAGPSIAAFLALAYFTEERDRARAVLAEQHRLLEAEQARSERLLLNILPAQIARRLRDDSSTIADRQPAVTVLFADLVGFTALADRIGADALVDLLNRVFSAFDELGDARGLEKIKTIGDAYMVVGGVPTPRDDHCAAVLEMARAMLEVVATIHGPDGRPLQLRIGVDTGPVVAGVIGRRKFSYDLWGDTVNTASRMEAHGVPGRVHVTERVARAAGDRWAFEPRGLVDVKGKGPMATHLLVAEGGAADESGASAGGR